MDAIAEANARAEQVKPSKSLIELHYGVEKKQITRLMISDFFKMRDSAVSTRRRALVDDLDRQVRNVATRTQNPIFLKACEIAGIAPTKRQASKWNRQTGRAWSLRREAKRALGLGQAVVVS